MLQRKRWLFALLAILPTLAIFAWVRIYPDRRDAAPQPAQVGHPVEEQALHRACEFRELFSDPLFHRSAAQHHHHRLRRAARHHPAGAGPRGADPPPYPLALRRLLRDGDLHSARRLARARGDGMEVDLRRPARPAERAACALRHSAEGLAVRSRPLGHLRHRALLVAGAGLCRADLSRRLQEPADLAVRGGQARRRLGLQRSAISRSRC